MKRFLAKIQLLALALVLGSSLAFATDIPAVPDATGTAAEMKTRAKKELVDINTATVDELKRLPGLGEAYAKKIIAGRPYAKKDQLKSRKIIPPVLYDRIRDFIIAKQPKK